MEAQTPVRLIHFFDTRLHQILCGLHGFENRSTKHARGVTCPGCVGLLAERAGTGAPSASAAPGQEIAAGEGRPES